MGAVDGAAATLDEAGGLGKQTVRGTRWGEKRKAFDHLQVDLMAVVVVADVDLRKIPQLRNYSSRPEVEIYVGTLNGRDCIVATAATFATDGGVDAGCHRCCCCCQYCHRCAIPPHLHHVGGHSIVPVGPRPADVVVVVVVAGWVLKTP